MGKVIRCDILHQRATPLTILGFILNVGVIAVVFLMGYWHGFHNFIMGPVIGLLAKIKIVKHPNKMRENLRIQVENFKIEFRRLSTNVPFLILVVLSFTVYMLTKFSIPFFVGQIAQGGTGARLPLLVAAH